MKQEEFDFIKDAFSQILDDIGGNPDWSDAASAISADLGALERELEGKVVSLNKSPEKAAKKYLDDLFGKGKHNDLYIHLFIAGWKCRDDQMPMSEDTVLFNNGVAEGKRLMMEDAVEAKVVGFDILNRTILLTNIPTDLNMDDKVRIVILKAEEE